MNQSISIVIVSFRSPIELESCLSSLRKGSDGLIKEVIVIDNASGDETVELEAHFPEVRFFWNAENLGFARACNQGAEKASGKYLLFLNPDTEILPGSLGPLLKTLESNPDIGAVGPLSNFAGAWQNMVYFLPEDGKGFSDSQEVQKYLLRNFKGKLKSVKLLIGFCLLMSREFFTEIDCMDPELLLGMDDLDLSLRIRESGKSLAVVLDSFVYHAGQRSFRSLDVERRIQMEEYSKQKLSQKLAAQFGGIDKVPSSWDLWEVDWFQPKDHYKAKGKIHLLLLVENEELEKVTFSVKQWESVAHLTESLTLVNLGEKALDIQTDIELTSLHFKHQKKAKALSKSLALLEEGMVVVMKPGVSITGLILSKLIQEPIRDNCLCLVKDFEGDSPVTQAKEAKDLEELLQKEWIAFAMSDVENSRGSFVSRNEIFVHFWSAPQRLSALQSSLIEGVCWSDGVRFYADENLLEAVNTPYTQVFLKLNPLHLKGLHLWLRNLRKLGVQKVDLEFVNGIFPTYDPKSPFIKGGVHPKYVRRELTLAGFAIQEVVGQGEFKACAENYVGLESEYKYALEYEKLEREYSRLNFKSLAGKTESVLNKKVSIVLLAFNQVAYTKKCIDSILENVKQNIEIIVINNGSSDGTKVYLDSVPELRVVHNLENLGVAAGWNQGMDQATGDYFLILNNDVIVPPDAIENLVRAAELHQNVGVVAPRSNKIAGPQLIDSFKYTEENEIVPQLINLQKKNELSAWEFHRIKGFSLLLPREVVAQVGYFDEDFGKGNFEDDDYSVRLKYHGFRLFVADDSVIFHYGSVSFQQAGVDWNALMKTNQQLFQKKWAEGRGSSASPLKKETLDKIENKVFQETEFELQHQLTGSNSDAGVYLRLSELKRKENNNERAFHYFICALEKEPESVEIAQKVIEFLTQNYPVQEYTQVIEFLKNKFSTNRIWQDTSEGEKSGYVDLSHIENEMTQFFDRQEFSKAQSYLNSVKQEISKSLAYQLQGLLHYYKSEYLQAFAMFGNLLEIEPTNEDALFNYFDTGVRLKMHQPVLEKLEYALSVDPSLKEIQRLIEELKFHKEEDSQTSDQMIALREMNLITENCIREGLLEEAEKKALETLAIEENQFRALNNLGLIHWYKGDVAKAWELFVRSVESNFFYSDAILNLYDVCILANQADAFYPILEKAISYSPENEDLLKIQKEMQEKSTPPHLAVYFESDKEINEQKDALAHARTLLENEQFDQATLAYLNILEADKENADCYNALGVIAFYWQEYQDAYTLLKQSLDLKLLNEDALLNFWDTAKRLGKEMEAKVYLKEALELEPSFRQVAEILELSL